MDGGSRSSYDGPSRSTSRAWVRMPLEVHAVWRRLRAVTGECPEGEKTLARRVGQWPVDCIVGCIFFYFFGFFRRKKINKQNVLTAKAIIKQCTHINIHQCTPNVHQQTPPWPKKRTFSKNVHVYAYPCVSPIWPVTRPVCKSPLECPTGSNERQPPGRHRICPRGSPIPRPDQPNCDPATNGPGPRKGQLWTPLCSSRAFTRPSLPSQLFCVFGVQAEGGGGVHTSV